MSEVKLFRLSGSALAIDMRTGHNATLRPGLVVLSEDAHTHALEALAAECERLQKCVAIANSNHEQFERSWYLACDERDAALAELENCKLAWGLLKTELSALKGGREPVEWRPVVGYEGLYSVSSNGDVRNDVTGLLLSSNSLVGSGYTKASLHKDGQRKQTTVHRIVAEAFLEKTGEEVNHKNGIKTDNRVSNLEWCSRSHNVNHSYYELGNYVNPIEAVSASSGAVEKFRSVEEAVRDGGFDSAHIYRCLNNPHKTHKGFHFRKSSAPPAQASAWVAVSERLPEDNAPILVAYKFGGTYIRCRSVIEHDLAAAEPMYGERDRPTYWQPLPAAPTPGASDGKGGEK